MERQNRNKIWILHALRGIAAISVVVYHYCFVFWYENGQIFDAFPYMQPRSNVEYLIYFNLVDALKAVGFNLGLFGVALFFIISGFVIPMSLKKTSGGAFLISRFFRIYPTYIIGFSITFLAIYVYTLNINVEFPYTLKNYLYQILLIRDWFWLPSIDGVSWTLETEIKFYLLIWGIWFLGTINNPKTIALSTILLCGINILLHNKYELLLQNNLRLYQIVNIITYSTINISFMFLGVCFYNYHAGFWSLKKIFVTLQVVFLSFVLAALNGPNPTYTTIQIVSYTVAFLVFINVYLLKDSIKYNKILDFFANISYPLYIVHGVIAYILMTVLDNRYRLNPYFSMTIAFIVTIAVAFALHLVVEERTNQFGKKVARLVFKDKQQMETE